MRGETEVIDMTRWTKVKLMHKKGIPIKRIARELNISRNTVKKIIRDEEEPRYKRRYYPSKVEKYKPLIKTWYLEAEYQYIGTRIHEELLKLGYTGSINPIYRYLGTLKDERNSISSKATVRIETPPGEQAQFDWSEYNMMIGDKLRKVYCFSLILAYSRMKAIVFSLSCDGDAIYESIQELFSELGGVTYEILIDNPKALVESNENGKETKYNLNALRLAAHLGVDLNACAPYRARTKGKVEKPFIYIEEHFVKGNSFKNMSELNHAAKTFIEGWCNKKHSTIQRTPYAVHKEELSSLLPLPRKKFMTKTMDRRKVSLDCLVSYNAVKYSVPAKYAAKEVFVRLVYGYKLEVYSTSEELIAVHNIDEHDGKIVIENLHYKEIQHSAPKSIPEIKRQMTNSFVNGSRYIQRSSEILQQPSYHAREFLKLKDLYTDESLDKILGYCVDNGFFEILAIKQVIKEKYLEIIRLNDSGPNDELMSSDSIVRDVRYYDQGGQF